MFPVSAKTKRAEAALCTIMLVAPLLCAQGAGSQPQKKYKEGEYDIVSQAYKDAGEPSKQLPELDTWAQKFPDSDFKDDRAYLYIQAYSKLNQQAKTLQFASILLSKDLGAIFSGPATVQLAGLPIKLAMMNVLYSAAMSAAGLSGATPEQLALGEKAAKGLIEFGPKYFTPENRPSSQTEAAWNAARADVANKAKSALVGIALKPGLEAKEKKDCPGQETGFSQALRSYPESGAVAYQLGVALLTCDGSNPDKVSRAVWEIARASALDPAASGIDPKDLPEIRDYLKRVYARIHGGDDGLEKLRQDAALSPDPPAGFKIQTTTEIALEKEAEFERSNPQLALWMKIKKQLTEINGDQYFQGQLKDAAVPQLLGTLVEARPDCRPKELLVAVPVPDAHQPLQAEIVLKLDKPLTGKPQAGDTLRWEGVPAAFSKEPFLLTMDTETAKIVGLKTSPCTAAPASPAAKNNTASRK